MRKIILYLIGITLLPLSSIGQLQSVLPVSTAKNGSLTAVVYDWEAIGVNPANLGWEVNHKFSFTILDIGASGQSQGMSFPGLLNATQAPDLSTRAATWQQILGPPRGMVANADVNWFACSFRIPAIPGAFACNMRDRISSNAVLGPNASQALVNSDDGNYKDAAIMSFLNGTNINFDQYREINLDYGVKILSNSSGFDDDQTGLPQKCFSFGKRTEESDDEVSSYIGVGVKYIFGVADMNGEVYKGGINALYDIDNNYPNIPSGFFNTPGHGAGFDLGAGEIYKRWKFSLSVTDMGFINWRHALQTTKDTNVAPIQHGNDFMSELKNGTLAGSVPAPNYTTYLASKARAGASYKVNKRFLLSADVIFPLNRVPGGLTGPYFALGGQWKAWKYVTISTGFAATQHFGWGIPLGATIRTSRHIEFYLGTNDITAYLGKPNDANVSVAVWSFRYNL